MQNNTLLLNPQGPRTGSQITEHYKHTEMYTQTALHIEITWKALDKDIVKEEHNGRQYWKDNRHFDSVCNLS